MGKTREVLWGSVRKGQQTLDGIQVRVEGRKNEVVVMRNGNSIGRKGERIG